MNKITGIVNGRICGVLLPGASILELEKEILYYENIDICWVGLNNFTKIENNILSKINKHFDIIQDCAEVKYPDEFEKEIRIPGIEQFLSRNENNFLLSSPEIIINWNKVNRLDLFTKNQAKIGLFDYGIHYSVPNSLTLLLMYLGRYSNAKFIILFGCDSYNGSSSDINGILSSYYNPEEILNNRLVGFKDGTISGLVGEMKNFDNNILNYYTNFAWQNGIQPPPIYNCSHLTSITSFKVINYAEARKICGLLDNETELIQKSVNSDLSNVINRQRKKVIELFKNIEDLKIILKQDTKSNLIQIESELKNIENELKKYYER